MKIEPTPNNVLIRPLDTVSRTKDGIYLPKKRKSQRGKVVAMGKRILPDGTVLAPEFKVGDVIIHKKWEGQEVRLDASGKPLLFVKHKDILAVEGK